MPSRVTAALRATLVGVFLANTWVHTLRTREEPARSSEGSAGFPHAKVLTPSRGRVPLPGNRQIQRQVEKERDSYSVTKVGSHLPNSLNPQSNKHYFLRCVSYLTDGSERFFMWPPGKTWRRVLLSSTQ